MILPPFLLEPVRVERVAIAITDLPPDLEGCKIVHLSDLHYDGQSLGDGMLQEAIALVNAENPDLIALTGDYISDDPAPMIPLANHLKDLKSRCGVVASLGNHDNQGLAQRQAVIDALQSAEIMVLWNAIAYPLGPGLAVVGLADLWSREFKPQPVFAALPPGLPRLVLSHNPDSAAQLQSCRVDLQLAGHTHGGQIVLPSGEPLLENFVRWKRRVPLPVAKKLVMNLDFTIRHWEWVQGHHWLGRNQLYVNRGLGSYFPGRLNCPPEVTVLTLNAK
ncbi:metallophosphoesterase [Spirulina sp. CCNP1310]|uniref:metallophosphoesterase n=1 Tax=Spirulina sp. CCNP1310 TaxID=3110249 RepID=UPI002B21796C|nr:metallophosphoesterase [Spirulina sp. CCNP1310]MEA5419055.1 metallophosphoesterase [Spirulina sp. CCNP1310]